MRALRACGGGGVQGDLQAPWLPQPLPPPPCPSHSSGPLTVSSRPSWRLPMCWLDARRCGASGGAQEQRWGNTTGGGAGRL